MILGDTEGYTVVRIKKTEYERAQHNVFLRFPQDVQEVYNVSWDDTWKLVWPYVDDLQLELVAA